MVTVTVVAGDLVLAGAAALVGVVALAGAAAGVTLIMPVAGAVGTHHGGDLTPITAWAGAVTMAEATGAADTRVGAGVVLTVVETILQDRMLQTLSIPEARLLEIEKAY